MDKADVVIVGAGLAGLVAAAELALNDWMGSAQFDGPQDHWPRQWAERYIDFAAGDMRGWLHAMGIRWFPIVGWAERGGSFANGHGNSVPRFHLAWGVGPGVQAPFEARVRAHENAGRIHLRCRDHHGKRCRQGRDGRYSVR